MPYVNQRTGQVLNIPQQGTASPQRPTLASGGLNALGVARSGLGLGSLLSSLGGFKSLGGGLGALGNILGLASSIAGRNPVGIASNIGSLGLTAGKMGLFGSNAAKALGGMFSLAPSQGINNLGGLVGAGAGSGLLGAIGPVSAGLGAANFFGNLGQKGVNRDFLGPFGFSSSGQTLKDLKAEQGIYGNYASEVQRDLAAGKAVDPSLVYGWLGSPVLDTRSSRGFQKQIVTPEQQQADPLYWNYGEGPIDGLTLRVANEILKRQRERQTNQSYITPGGRFELMGAPRANEGPAGTGRFIDIPAFRISPDAVDKVLEGRSSPYTFEEIQNANRNAMDVEHQHERAENRKSGSKD